MSETGTSNGGAGGRARLVDWGLPLFAAACGAVLLFESSRLPLFEQYAGLGAGFVPLIVGLALTAIAIGIAVQIARGARFEPEAAEGADADAPVSAAQLGMAALAVASPIVTFPFIGFPVGAALAFALVARAFGSRNSLMDCIIGIVVSSLAWLAFSKLGVQLGPFLPFGV